MGSDPQLICVYDTETTDKWLFKEPDGSKTPVAWNDVRQPNLCQFGMKIYTDKAEVLFETGINIDMTDHPTWKGIAPEAQAVHGISEELLKMWGEGPAIIPRLFSHWLPHVGLFVAHNEEFDRKIVQCFLHRIGEDPDFIKSKPSLCTMKSTTNICKIPNPSGYGGFKWPKLPEAYCRIVDPAGFKNAHNALADVNPCAEIFWQLHKAGLVKLPWANQAA